MSDNSGLRCSLYKLPASSKGDTIFDSFNQNPPQDEYSDYPYWNDTKGDWSIASTNMVLGYNYNQTNQKLNGISIGTLSGNKNQSTAAIAIGFDAGYYNQGQSSIAIGINAGKTGQSFSAIAIGANSGSYYQKANTIAIGKNAGLYQQGTASIAIGYRTGLYQQSTGAIAIGTDAGQINQPSNTVAIGQKTGQTSQNSYTVSIGPNTGKISQISGSIIINADPSANMNSSGNTIGTFINPIRGPIMGASVLSYDTATKEIYFTGSSKRYKYDIQPLSTNTENVYKLQPREFKYNISGINDVGLIAEEADKCDPWFAYKDKDGIPEGIQWNVITTYLIAELKKLKNRKTQLREELKILTQ